jgi:dTDP-4-dehydrorhamnose reductase
MSFFNGPDRHPPLELWAGVECSVVRVGGTYYDQLERSGHAYRIEDLEQIAGLGVKALRYPLAWERIAPDRPDRADWSWADERLTRLRTLGIRPIVGLVHHGSGPQHTSLIDPSFADGLAAHAGEVARRYPWVMDYTPVNEPLTTARFSALYGFWYPHERDNRLFIQALLNQCRAVVLAMRAIRRINPRARLVQTEDLGKTYSTPPLAYQADYENERRWLDYDLLCGRVGPGHGLWNDLLRMGTPEDELRWFLDNPCVPDILGVNHYLTSERFLDHRIEHYPAELHGSNAFQSYVDVEAVRVCEEGLAGPGGLLGEVWERYRLPIAVTEAHLGCTREEQLRWFHEVWESAQAVRRAGADVRAVTVWAVMGSYDWDSLLTIPRGNYEPGAFDLRSPRPRGTALASLLRDLAAGRDPDHPVLGGEGWWRRPERLIYPVPEPSPGPRSREVRPGRGRTRARSLAIVGASGALGRVFDRLCELRGLSRRLLSRRDLDMLDQASIDAALDRIRPWAVVNAVENVRVDEAEAEPELSRRRTVDGPAKLAAACARRGIALLCFSSDQVFGGDNNVPYRESDPVDPRNVYGASKVLMESRVQEAYPGAFIARTGGLFSPWDADHFVAQVLRTLASRRPFPAADDLFFSPTYMTDLAHAALDLMIDGEHGIWHLANAGSVTWAGLARQVAILGGMDPSGVRGLPAERLGLAARRPYYTVLGSERGSLLQSLEDCLACYFRDTEYTPADPTSLAHSFCA